MRTTSRIAIGLGIASGAIVAAWLLTGDRGQKTKRFIVRRARTLKSTAKVKKKPYDDSEVHYV